MNTTSKERVCLSCNGSNLADGRTGVHRHTFIPATGFYWVGFETKAFACLDCGFIGHYLDGRELRKLREKINR